MIDNRFVFIIPTFNSSETIGRMLFSVWFQTYGNWRMIIRDDVSTDSTSKVVEDVTKMLGIQDRVYLETNLEKKWEVRNIVESLQMCNDDDIVCRLDGDDWLCDSDALTIINERYNSLGSDAIWTSHRWGFSNHNISGPLPRDADPYVHPWVSSHFKTFRRGLLSNVKDDNFRSETGQYFKRIGDQAIYLPVLKKARGNWHYEPIVAYHYTIDMSPATFQTDDAKFQKSEAEYLRRRGFVT